MKTIKTIILTGLLFVSIPEKNFANTGEDGKQAVAKTVSSSEAKKDVLKFKLDKNEKRRFNEDRTNAESDLFKPTLAYASNPSLLTDSTYVKTFRALAFQKSRRKHSIGHYLLVGGASFGTAIAITTLAVAGSR